MPTSPHVPPAFVMFVGLYLMSMLAAWAWLIGRLRTGRPILEGEGGPPRNVPWGLGSVVLIVLLYLAMAKGVVTLVDPWIRGAGAVPLGQQDAESEAFALEQMLLVAVINLLMIVLIPLIVAVGAGGTRYDLGLALDRRTLGRNVATGVVACLLVSPVVYSIQILAVLRWHRNLHPMELMIRENRSAPVVILAFLSGVVLAPIAEELFFRGVLMGWFAKLGDRLEEAKRQQVLAKAIDAEARATYDLIFEPASVREANDLAAPREMRVRSLGPVMPNLLTSLIFAGIHADQWPAPVAIFILSLALGSLYQRTGRLIAPIVLHAMFNGVSTFMVFACAK
jgi:membrane protease YdiL (CAAX protease family)